MEVLSAEPNEFHYGILRLPVNGGTADMFAKWPILAEKASPESSMPHFPEVRG